MAEHSTLLGGVSCVTKHLTHAQVVSVAATFSEVWEAVGGLLTEVDVLAAFAELAVTAPLPYVRPAMLPPDTGELSLVGCRCRSRTQRPLLSSAWLWADSSWGRLQVPVSHAAATSSPCARFAP